MVQLNHTRLSFHCSKYSLICTLLLYTNKMRFTTSNQSQFKYSSDPFENPFKYEENSELIGDYFGENGVAYTQIDYDPSMQERKHASKNKTNTFT